MYMMFAWYLEVKQLFQDKMFLKRLSFGNKECTKELKLECANFLGQTN